MICEEGTCTLRPSPDDPAAVLLRGAPPDAACAGAALVVSAEPVRGRCSARVVDRFSVWRDGAHAAWLEPAGWRVLSDRAARGAPLGAPDPGAPQRGVPRGAAAARARSGIAPPAQYFRTSPTSRPCTLTRSGPKMRVS